VHKIARGYKSPHRDRLQAQIVLDAAVGHANAAIARRCRVTPVRTGGMSPTTASSMLTSGTLAPVTTAASGSPRPSQTRWSLDPGLPRSTGFALS
jgi:hypothetical protein